MSRSMTDRFNHALSSRARSFSGAAASAVMPKAAKSKPYSPLPIGGSIGFGLIGPLITGACAGAGRGAGMRLCMSGTRGGGSTLKPCIPCPLPGEPAADAGVNPAMKAAVTTAVKMGFMIELLDS
jgi:hypothetical protein